MNSYLNVEPTGALSSAHSVNVDVIAVLNAEVKDEFPSMYENIRVMLPDENTRRVGQSVAAASLPDIG